MGKLEKRHIGMKQTREPPKISFGKTKIWRLETTLKNGAELKSIMSRKKYIITYKI